MMGFIIHHDDILVIIYCKCCNSIACMVCNSNVLIVREDYKILRIVTADRKSEFLIKKSCLCVNLIHGNRILTCGCAEQMPSIRCKCKTRCCIMECILILLFRKCADTLKPLSSIEVPRRRRLEGMQEEYERQGFDPAMIHVISGKREDQETITGNKHYDTGYGLTRKYFKKREELLYKKKEDSEAAQILKEKKKVEKIEKIKQEDISSKHAIENKEDVKETGLENITAFVGTNDFVAIGIMDAITSLGYRIPEDFSVCGFDNTLVASFSGISLTTIDHCIGEKGAYAVSMLMNQKNRMEQKDGKREKKRPIMRLEYEPQLIVRHSTGRR